MEITVEQAIKNTEASLRMEGMQPTQDILNECRKIFTGEITYEQYVNNVLKEFTEA